MEDGVLQLGLTALASIAVLYTLSKTAGSGSKQQEIKYEAPPVVAVSESRNEKAHEEKVPEPVPRVAETPGRKAEHT